MTRTTTLGAQFAPTFHRPFLRYFDGENGAPGTPPATPPVETSAASPPVPTPPPAAATPPPPPAQTPPVQYRGNPDEYVRELREEARGHRVSFENEQTAHNETKTELATAAQERDTLRRENTLILAAPKYGARPDLLLDSSSFMKTFADIDLADEAAVKKAIEDALEKNSTFKATTLPAASGGGHQGGDQTQRTKTLADAVAQRLTAQTT